MVSGVSGSARLKTCTAAFTSALLFAPAAAAQHGASAPPPGTTAQAGVAPIKDCYPAYPRESLAAEETGLTRLRMHVSASGQLRGVSLVQSSGFPRLDAAAIDGLSRCQFKAATQDGVPIDSSFILEYRWQLDGPPPAAAGGCKPEYPAGALRAGEQGKTLIRFQLTAAGEAENINVVQSSGSARLDEASIAHVRRCRFNPPKPPSPGTPAKTFDVEYNWRLEDNVPMVPVVPVGPVTPDPYRPRL